MGQHHLPGQPPVPLTLRRSARARRISLRISQLDGRVTLTLPPGVPEREAIDFAQSKADWIRGHLARHMPRHQPGFGDAIPIEGAPTRIVPASGRRIQLRPGLVEVPPQGMEARLHRFLRELARDRLAAACDFYASELGRPYARISLRDTRSRWGSCTTEGALMFSWRLILAPPSVLRYVAAHEVAHLAEMNHSSRFWAEVTRIHGPYVAPRQWLRDNGTQLHSYRFDSAAS
ncbi:M48 family metallopeptidase [Ruegeria pomeroyi]|nr:SprT family zinc-dependent metalloprotease [Ruegeria pomeroyi]NVK96390.1 M48 family metallopeptidase [Ruegeria pomeroyi]NVL01736.1 M48 family metallopeptidase [Ruegeria pomeroyi]QWV10374.1 M48 family metallopeptidase [Ruegeria pomeroyi]